MAFSTVTIATDDVSALVVAHNQVASQLSALFASAGVFSGTLTVTSLATFSGPVSIAGSLTVTGVLNAAVLSAAFATSAAGSTSAFALSSTLTVTSAATFSAPVTISGMSGLILRLQPETSYTSVMLAVLGQGMNAGSATFSTTAPIVFLFSTPSATYATIENRSSGTITRVGFTARADAGNLAIQTLGTGNTGTFLGLAFSNLAEMVVGSAAAFLIRTAGLSAPVVVATNNVERFRADSGGVSVVSNLSVGSSVFVRSAVVASGTLTVTSQATFSGPVYFYGSATFVSTASGITVVSADFAQSATSAAFAQSATSAAFASIARTVIDGSQSAAFAQSATSAAFAQSATSATFATSAREAGSGFTASSTLNVTSLATFSGPVYFYGSATFASVASGVTAVSADFAQSATSAAFAQSATSAAFAASTLFHGVLVTRNTGMSLVTGTQIPISWASAIYDTASFWVVGSPALFTISTGVSRIRVTGNYEIDSDSRGSRFAAFYHNSLTHAGLAQQWYRAHSQGAFRSPLGTAVFSVVSGDTIFMTAYQDAGVTVSLANAASSTMWMALEVIQ